MELAEAISILEDEEQEIFNIATGFNEKWKQAYKIVIQVAKNSIPKEKVRNKVDEVTKLIENEQFKVIMGDTTICSRIKWILQQELLEEK